MQIETMRQQAEAIEKKLEAAVEADEFDQTEFDRLKAELETAQKRIEAAEHLEQRKAAAARPVHRLEPGTDDRPYAEAKAAREPGLDFARFTKALAMGGGQSRAAADYAERQSWPEKDTLAKALGSSIATDGGFLVPEGYSADVVRLLRAAQVVMRAGPRTLPLAGSLNVAKLTSGATGSYIGENTNIGKEQQTFGNLRLTEKKLASIVPISNDLIRNSSPEADAMVRDDMVAGLATTADAALIRDDGTAAAPKGWRYWANSANVTASAGTSATNIEADIQAMMGALQDNNVPMERVRWFMSPREHRALYLLRDANGNLMFPEVRVSDENAPGGRLFGFPIYTTTNIPTTLGGGDEGEVYLVDMAQVIIGMGTQLEITVSNTAAYYDGANVVAAFSQDQTVVRAIMRHDQVLRHDYAVAVKTGVQWGA